MDSPTAIAQGIHATDGKAAYDEACKKLLSQKIILAWIMKTCLEEYRDLDVKEIAEKYIEGKPSVGKEPVFPDGEAPLIQGIDTTDKSLREGTITYDILFHATAPTSGEQISLIVNIEAQNDFSPGYPLLKRAIYYCSRMISSQYNKGFTHSRYDKLKKVYSIFICMDRTKKRSNTITRYHMKEENLEGAFHAETAHYDLLSVVLLCLGDAGKETPNKLLRLLNTLLSSQTSEREKCELLENEFDIPMTSELESEVSTMCNLSQGVEEKGRQEGRQEGIVEGILLSLRNAMKNRGMPIEEALDMLGVPKGDWQKYRQLLMEK